MTNCTITLDVTGFGYTYLLQLDAMLGDFLEDGSNAAAADTLHDWMADNARNFADDARANGDTLAADIFSDIAAEAEGGNDPDQYTLPADDDKANQVEQIILREGLGVTIETICNAGGYTTQVVLTGDANEIQRVLDELEAPEAANEEPAHTPAYAAIEEYLGCPEGEFLKGILEEAAEDARRDHTNLFKAGYFEGAARMLAAAIVNDGAAASVAEITRAAYQYCGLPW